MRLYGHPLSPRYRRVAVAAAELGAPVDLVVLDVRGGEPRSAPYLAKNAMGKMPTLEDDDGWTLWESWAIAVYLAEKFPERGLFPTDARGRAEALRWMFWCAAHLEPAVATLYGQKVLAPMRGQGADGVAVSAATKEVARYLPILEAHLATHEWMLGDRFGLVDVLLGVAADVLLHPQIAWDRASAPHVVAWRDRLAERPSWTAGRG